VRFSDFKSNEYRNLLGGEHYEPHEENPMIGWRGAARYYSDTYKEAFGLECKAIRRVREKMGLKNVVVMIPFCRTVEELLAVKKVMKEYGLERGKEGLELYLMAEIPSNILMAEEFAQHIDGFSIGSNDLTQLTLGLDRDSALVSHLYDERNPAVKRMLEQLIRTAKRTGTKVGICGQGPSDHPDFAQFLVELGIDSISVTPDSLLKTRRAISEVERIIAERKS
jgi:pyruvate,water dikinase